MANLELSLACQPTDRTQAVVSGDLAPEGIDLQPVPLEAEVASHRMLAHEDFDGAEVALAGYIGTVERDDPRFIAIPVFTARAFVHSAVYVHREASIEEAGDLADSAVGIRSYWSTPGVWIRGILEDHHGVDPGEIAWVRDSEDPVPHEPPPPDDVDVTSADRPLAAMLADGELDALVSTRRPSGFPDGPVERLFPDCRSTERAYYRETGHFPILRVIVVRRAVYDRYPWVAQELVKTFDAAKERCLAAIGDGLDYSSAVPWLGLEIERTRALMGWDYWPYGIDANRETLSTLVRYADEQGLTDRRYELEDLFAQETFKAFTV